MLGATAGLPTAPYSSDIWDPLRVSCGFLRASFAGCLRQMLGATAGLPTAPYSSDIWDPLRVSCGFLRASFASLWYLLRGSFVVLRCLSLSFASPRGSPSCFLRCLSLSFASPRGSLSCGRPAAFVGCPSCINLNRYVSRNLHQQMPIHCFGAYTHLHPLEKGDPRGGKNLRIHTLGGWGGNTFT